MGSPRSSGWFPAIGKGDGGYFLTHTGGGEGAVQWGLRAGLTTIQVTEPGASCLMGWPSLPGRGRVFAEDMHGPDGKETAGGHPGLYRAGLPRAAR